MRPSRRMDGRRPSRTMVRDRRGHGERPTPKKREKRDAASFASKEPLQYMPTQKETREDRWQDKDEQMKAYMDIQRKKLEMQAKKLEMEAEMREVRDGGGQAIEEA